MTLDELKDLLRRLQLDYDAAPTLVYVFYQTADGLVNNFSISLRRARSRSGRPMTPEQLGALMQQYPAAAEGKIMAIEHPRQGLSQWMDMADVCRRLHVSRRTLTRWQQRGLLHPTRIGRRLYFNTADIEALLRSHLIQENGRLDKTSL